MSAALADLVAELGGDCDGVSLAAPRDSDRESRAAIVIHDVQLDSRLVGAGDLFAALPGRAADGARFTAHALARGAAAVLSPAPLDLDALQRESSANRRERTPNWVHPEARRVAGEAAAVVLGRPSRGMFVAAVTGTNGKTTTAHLTAQLLAQCGRRPAVLGTAGHRLAGGVEVPASHTTPDAPELQRLLARHRELGGDSVALELSSHALDQDRHAGLDIRVAQFTNLTQDHLDYHGDLERYAQAKERLFASLSPGAFAVINADDPAGARMAAAARASGASVHTYSTRSRGDLAASGLESDAQGAHFNIFGMGIQRTRVRLPLSGRFNVENALAALAAVLLSGASPSQALAGLATVTPVPGRMERVDTGALGVTLLVDYAHSEDALRNVLSTVRATLAESSGARLICVFGCGGDRDRDKRPKMGAVAGELADLVVVTSDNPRSEDPRAIIDAIVSGMRESHAELHVEPDRRAAIALALELARPGDVLLLAGKGHETTQTIAGRAFAFDDRAVARELAVELAQRK
jgi:UDP-N-acetylmuramoyl-L-alanyl-D-glutamate--2,6-diaminopimelate ligase